MLLQRQHFLLSYLKTLRVGPRPGFEPRASRSADRRLSHYDIKSRSHPSMKLARVRQPPYLAVARQFEKRSNTGSR